MRIVRVCIVVISLLHLQSILSAQSFTYRIEYYDNEEGLSQSSINCIIQDKLGYMWFGTQDGLNRFNGYEFEVFRNDPENDNSLSDNFIMSIDSDKNGDLWIGTRGGGLNKYELATGHITRFQKEEGNPNSLAHDRVRAVKVGSNGLVWIGTRGGGVSVFDPKNNSFTNYIPTPNSNTSLAGSEVYALYEDYLNHIWVGTTQGLSEIDPESRKIKSYLRDGIEGNTSEKAFIRTIYQDAKGQMWLGFNQHGLARFNQNNGELSYFRNRTNDKTSLSNNSVFSIVEDRSGDFWVGTKGVYLNKFNRNKGTFERVEMNSSDTRALYEDIADNLWIGNVHGLNRVNRTAQKFRFFRNTENNKSVLSDNNTFAILKDHKNRLWVGSYSHGISKIDLSTGSSEVFSKSKGNGLQGNQIRSVFQDSEKNIWVGTRYNGLFLYNELRNVFEPFDLSVSSKLPSPKSINHIFEDKNHNLWFSTFDGIRILDPSTQKIEVLQAQVGENSLFSNGAWNVTEDHLGNFWIALYASGLDYYDVKNNTFTHFENDPNEPTSLSNNGVSQIFEDSQNRIWVAIYGGGLDYFDPNTKSFQHYSRKNGLSNTALYGILEDGNGRLWMSHNMGLSSFDPELKKFENYSVNDGLFGNEFNSGAFYKAGDGEMYFGGREGVVALYPENIGDNNFVPPVYVNEISLFNTPLEVEKDGVMDSLPEFENFVKLDYQQGYISFHFVALNYVNASKNQYQYQLEGFDKDWITGTNARTANYTNIPPGRYTFRVRGSNNDGVWNNAGDAIYLVVHTPWWQQAWFIAIVLLFIVMLLYGGLKLRLRNANRQKQALELLVQERTSEIGRQKEQLAAQNETLTQLNKEKNELIGIVSHDLRSPLNQVKGLTNLIQMADKNLSQETGESIDRINALVERLGLMVSRILNINAIESRETNLNLEQFNFKTQVEAVTENFKPMANNKNIVLTKEFEEGDFPVYLDKYYVIEIVENLISNAIKFSERNTMVVVALLKRNKTLELSVTDQGPGISDREMALLFTGYKQLSAKPTGGEDSSGIGLSIVKRYVQAMKGKVHCESELGKGSSFIVCFPMEK